MVDLLRCGLTIGLDDQPCAAVLLYVVAEDLVLAFMCIEVQRMAGIGHLGTAIVPSGRPEKARPRTSVGLGLAGRQHRRPVIRAIAVALRPSATLGIEQVNRLARGVVEHRSELAVGRDDHRSYSTGRFPRP